MILAEPLPEGAGQGAGWPSHPTARRSLKVLHIFRHFRPEFTGEGIYLEKLAVHLARRGVPSDVIVEATAPPAQAARMPSLGAVKFFGREQGPRQVNLAMLAWLLLHARGYDAVHFHCAVDRFFLPQLVVKLAGCRIVQSCTLDDGIGSIVASYRPAFRGVVARLCRLIDVAVAISPRLYEDNAGAMPAERLRLVPQGVEIPALAAADRAQARARWGFAPSDIVLLFVGGLVRRKDVRFLVENHLQNADPGKRIILLVVGPALEPDYAASLRDTAEQRGIDVRFAGFMEDPAPAYRAADIFVFASRLEGFGNVIVEAMAFGLPVVCRRLAGVTDYVIDDGETGILFDTAEEYRAAIARLAGQSASRRRLGNAARRAAIARFSMDVIAGRFARLYRG